MQNKAVVGGFLPVGGEAGQEAMLKERSLPVRHRTLRPDGSHDGYQPEPGVGLHACCTLASLFVTLTVGIANIKMNATHWYQARCSTMPRLI